MQSACDSVTGAGHATQHLRKVEGPPRRAAGRRAAKPRPHTRRSRPPARATIYKVSQFAMYVCLLLQDLYKSCARGGGVKRGDVCYGMLRAAACVDESDHHALMYVRHGQTVRKEGVDE